MVLGQTEYLQTISSTVMEEPSAIHISVCITRVCVYIYNKKPPDFHFCSLLTAFSPSIKKESTGFSNEDFGWVCLNYANE